MDNESIQAQSEIEFEDSPDDEVIKEVIDCDVFFPNNTCKENFNDLEKLNVMEKVFEYFDRFLSCSSTSCFEYEKKYLKERTDMGDPNAMYTLSVFHRFGVFNYSKDEVLSGMYLSFASESGSAIAALSEGTRYQCGYHKIVNATKMSDIILPAWRMLYHRNESLFDSLYSKTTIDWPTDVMSKSYDVNDYLEVLREQMSEEKFKATQRAVYLSKKNRNYKGLLDLYKDDPQEQHLFGFMYLEGLGVPRDYAKAWYYFDNSSNPLFNSSYCVFGKGIIYFYGLGVEMNETAGCELIDRAFRMNLLNPVFMYYNGLCKLRQHRFAEANDDFSAASFQQFTPAVDSVLRMKEMNLGQRMKLNASGFFGSILISHLREFFKIVVDKIRDYNDMKNTDGGLLYEMIAFDLNLPYWGTHMMDLFEKRIWKGYEPKFLFNSLDETNSVYRDSMEFILSISPDNEHAIDVAKAYIEGGHGYEQNLTIAREMLMTIRTKSAPFYLGVINYEGKDFRDIESSKMYLDKAIASNSHVAAALVYRLRLIGTCIWKQIQNGEWKKGLTILMKTLILDHEDLVFDNNCNLITQVENHVNVETVLEWAIKMSEEDTQLLKKKSWSKFLFGDDEEELNEGEEEV